MQGMRTPRRYSRSPITEAIIDFQVELPESVGLTELERCQDPAYPGKQAPTAALGPGIRFASGDEKQFFQVHLDGFTLYRLAPYQGWEPFRDEARRLWAIYRQTVHPWKVTRLALRYVNRLDLPLAAELKDYLRTSPQVSPGLPQGVAGFYLQLTIPQPDLKSTLLLREALGPPTAPGGVSVVLDIDLFRSDDVPADEDGIWAFLESLRGRKNEVFEACITDRTREVIQ
jgi:uncharacterized protein (TIGR04255 family)